MFEELLVIRGWWGRVGVRFIFFSGIVTIIIYGWVRNFN